MIEHGPGADRPRLAAALVQQAWAWVLLTSPEAAAVFLEVRTSYGTLAELADSAPLCDAQGWREAGRPQLRVATVGGGTSAVLAAAPERPPVAFTPSKANAETLSGALHLPLCVCLLSCTHYREPVSLLRS